MWKFQLQKIHPLPFSSTPLFSQWQLGKKKGDEREEEEEEGEEEGDQEEEVRRRNFFFETDVVNVFKKKCAMCISK